MNPNACSHPAIMYGQWEGWDGTPLDKVPMFYTGITEATGDLLTSMSDEVVELGKIIAERSGADMSQVIRTSPWQYAFGSACLLLDRPSVELIIARKPFII